MESKICGAVLFVLFMAWEVHGAVNCTAAGRFPDPDDTTCKNYSICVYSSGSNSYLTYNYVCPTTSVFNPNTAQCTDSSNYNCSVNNTPSSVCSEDGFFSDATSTNCSSYIGCVEVNGSFIVTAFSCPAGTYFDPDTTLCESTYTCPSTFTCTAAGRFPNISDTTCQAYFFCVLNAANEYIQYNYTCPTTSVFNPNSRVCTTSYTCTN